MRHRSTRTPVSARPERLAKAPLRLGKAKTEAALENARLFEETQRLFKQSEQRAAELAIVNSVQTALAAKLNVQTIQQLVGDKAQPSSTSPGSWREPAELSR